MDILPEVLNRFVSRPPLGANRQLYVNQIDGMHHDTLAECHAAIAQQLTQVGGLYDPSAKSDRTLAEIQNLLA